MTIEERFEKLELKLARTLFINRLLAVLGIGAVIAMWFFSSGSPIAQNSVMNVVRAKKFRLLDDNGKTRAILNMMADNPSIGMTDENGNCRIALHLFKDEPSIELSSKNGLITLRTSNDGPVLYMYNKIYNNNNQPNLMLSARKEGPVLVMNDKNGKMRLWLNMGDVGPQVVLMGENEEDRAVFGATQTKSKDGKTIIYPESSLILFGPDGPALWSAP